MSKRISPALWREVMWLHHETMQAICLGSFGAALAFGLMCCVPSLKHAAHADSDGTSARRAPVRASALEGKWCDARPAHLLCLEVYGPPDSKAYHWAASDCAESGLLSGGLEFSPSRLNPDGTPLCFASMVDPLVGLELYSASADFSSSGLTIYIDGQSEPLQLSYTR